MNTLLFDFDGTICDSLPLFLAAYNDYLKKHNRPLLTKNELRTIGIMELIKREHMSRLKTLWFLIIGRRYAKAHMKELFPIVGIKPVLEKLREDFTLGIVTSNSKRNAESFLKRNNIDHCFQFVESKLSLLGKAKKIAQVIEKYNLSKRDTLYIGDETRDINAAKEVGIKCIAVTWGVENEELFKKSQPDLTVSKPNELYKYLSAVSKKL